MDASVHSVGQAHTANLGARPQRRRKHAGKYSLQTTKEPKSALLEEVIVNMKAIYPARGGLEKIAPVTRAHISAIHIPGGFPLPVSGDRDHPRSDSPVLRPR